MAASFSGETYGLIAAFAATVLGVATSLIVARRVRRTELKISIVRDDAKIEITADRADPDLERTIRQLIATLETPDSEVSTANRDDVTELTVVSIFDDIESAGRKLIDSAEPPAERQGSRRGIFDLRRSLKSRGIWSDDDVVKFDNLTRIRNAIVHGDSEMAPSNTDLSSVLSDAQSLLAKLRT